MKSQTLLFIVLGILFLAPVEGTEAQFFKKLGKKARDAAQRGVENTVERKTEQKAEEKTDQAIETVFGIPTKKGGGKEQVAAGADMDGTWYYESLEGIPGYEVLNDCGKKSNIRYTGNTYTTQFYDGDCNLLTDSGGTFELKGNEMTVHAEQRTEMGSTTVTTVQTILEHTESKLVLRDEMTGAVVTLMKPL